MGGLITCVARGKYEGQKDSDLKNLPADTKVITIAGGNHVQYGDYGPQARDGVAAISREEQQRQTVAAVTELVNELK